MSGKIHHKATSIHLKLYIDCILYQVAFFDRNSTCSHVLYNHACDKATFSIEMSSVDMKFMKLSQTSFINFL